MMQYLDFSHASTSRKWTHKRQLGEGFDAPRNSMEFTMETPHSYSVFQEDVPYSCNMRQYPKASAPIKKLIHEDISFRSNEGHKRTPSVIARLMGMDSPPLNSTIDLTAHPDERRQEIITRPVPRRDPAAEMISTKHVSFVQHKNSVRHAPKQESRCYDDGDDEREMILGQMSKRSNGGGADQWSKPQPREHPQEEELQKFKKDFEAWQASRVWEQSRTLELDSHGVGDGDDERCSEIVPYRYQKQHHRGRDHGNKHVNAIDDVHWRRRTSKEGGAGASISGSRTFSLTSADDGLSTRLPLSRFYQEEERALSPTRIVVLKPCPELSADDVDESSLGSPELMRKENNMEAFLEEVKMRLKFELEGSIAADDSRAAADRWPAGGGAPAADPKQIARSIANQIRETVTKDLHPALLRSESTRSYRSSDVQSQMDFICRDARKQLADRLRNVLRREPETELPSAHRRRAAASTTATASWFEEEPRPKPPRRDDMARKGGKKIRSKEEKKRAIESYSDVRSLRHGRKNSAAAPAGIDSDDDTASPRNLMRSFSAPVSASTTFVKLLSEEPRVLTGARLQRRHEGHGSSSRPSPSPAPAPTEERQKGRKDAFGIKGRVSNLRQNLGLRGKLFGKKLHSAAADSTSSSSFLDDLPPIGTLVTAPSVLIHPGVLRENSTEVPPSPASWCSSPPDEMMIRGGYPSPVSPLEASFSEHRSPLKPAANSASEPGNPSSEQAQTEELAQTSSPLQDEDDDTAEMDDPMKAFIRAVLVAAGMYGTSKNSDHFFSSSQPKPIPKWVFEEVCSSSPAPASDGSEAAATVDRRLLFDLINELLPRAAVRGSAAALSCTFSKWYAAPRSTSNGKKLLDGLWRSVQARLEPPSDDVDGLIGRDLSASPWNGVFHGDVDELGEEVEAEMMDELIDETVWDVLLNVGD